MRFEDQLKHVLVCTDEDLNTLEDMELDHEYVAQMVFLNVSFNNLTDISGLSKYTGIRSLNISYNNILSLEGLEQLPQVKVLKCSHNQIQNISQIENYNSLEELWVSYNQIDIEALSYFQNLTNLKNLVLKPNPCYKHSMLDMFIISILPQLSSLNSLTVTSDQRLRAQDFLKSPPGREMQKKVINIDKASAIQRKNVKYIKNFSPNEKECSQIKAEQIRIGKRNFLNSKLINDSPEQVSAPNDSQNEENIAMESYPIQEYVHYEDVNHYENSIHTYKNQNQLQFCDEVEDGKSIECVSESNHKVETMSLLDAVGGLNDIISKKFTSKGFNVTTRKNKNLISQKSSCSLNDNSSSSEIHIYPPEQVNNTDSLIKCSTQESEHIGDIMVDNSEQEVKLQGHLQENESELEILYKNNARGRNIKPKTCVLIRKNGSGLAKWQNGKTAVSVDDDFYSSNTIPAINSKKRILASHEDGTVALSFSSNGVGFVNYNPSGKVMVTCSLMSCKHLDESGNLINEWVISDSANCNFSFRRSISSNLGFSITKDERSSALNIEVFFRASNIQYKFLNSFNSINEGNHRCDDIFESRITGKKKIKKKLEAFSSHGELVSGIRDAISGL